MVGIWALTVNVKGQRENLDAKNVRGLEYLQEFSIDMRRDDNLHAWWWGLMYHVSLYKMSKKFQI